MTNKQTLHIETLLAQAGNRTDDEKTGAISAPIYLSTAYRHAGLGQSTGFDYPREAQPTRCVLEATLAKLEEGVAAFALSSGMAAIQLVFTLFKSGDKIIVSDDLYGGSYRFFDLLHDHYQLDFAVWDGQDQAALAQLIDAKTVALWLETPSNPTMKVIDIAATAVTTHAHHIKLIVDNTFYTPLIQKPLTLGADIVVHSATKYLAGHNDILAGAVIAKQQTDADQLEFNLVTTGAVLDPFDAWLLLRSLKTLPLRMWQHEANAKVLVQALQSNPHVDKVLYPGRGGMISFYLADGVDVDKFLQALTVISFAESLGGVESLVTVPAVQTHADLSEAARAAKGITPNLLRLSTGIEAAVDLQADLTQALTKAAQ
ncbi:PLP-dependent transferase [Lactiplantibacillus fabifermentans]|uniref:O-succinylhomoserine (Thiol)-lyase n=2 Tax=Lactiplantibacillus fabifermentans TaxID=483011 RepID=A0A0R2NP37_9LACO|nr:PLP-dependent transferase [Lactiplantibacillus fabifermentans]ETY73543.1 cystathionine gamma-synthase [Lactiplantibacillus fabifermentans T30PCM01]KRO27465.1 o-succinylhomoserine (thiol)-lyase [Lactiplantibacillus fabifermentans DSM 21115]